MPKLGVNIDHVATLRQARQTYMPDPVEAARLCLKAGCDSIVCHLREDRRHINDKDVRLLRNLIKTRFNLEMSVAGEIVDIACAVRPDQTTLVPEKRQEVTTEGGLDVNKNLARVRRAVSRLQASGIEVSLFINPSKTQIEASLATGVRIIEFHTGEYANAGSTRLRKGHLEKLRRMTAYALSLGFEVNAGHGLNYENVRDVAGIRGINELNIGHSIISRAVFVGLPLAVREMRRLIS